MTRRKDGRFQEVVLIDGEKKYFYGKTKAEVLQKVRDYQSEQESGVPFARVAEDWWEQQAAKMAANSLRNYRAAYRRAVDAFGMTPIKTIRPRDVAAKLEAFAAAHADKTIKTQLGVYNLIFRYAVANGFLDYNPARDLPCPSGLGKTPRHSAPSDDLMRVKQSTDCTFGMFAFWALYTGLRRGELLALTWEDVDLQNREIHVTKSVYTENGKAKLKAPKTETSIATVPIFDALLEKIKGQKKKTGIIFPNYVGGYMTEDQFKRKWWKYCAESGVTSTPHQFRHSFATMLFENNVPPEYAQQLLRHAQLSTTMDIYTDIREKKLKEIHRSVYAIDIA